VKRRPKRIQNPGLLHGPTRIEIEEVTARHKLPCAGCERVPRTRRLKIVEGAGRAASTTVYCETCGASWLLEHAEDVTRAIGRLSGADFSVRRTRDE
jgi:hypothetical protein